MSQGLKKKRTFHMRFQRNQSQNQNLDPIRAEADHTKPINRCKPHSIPQTYQWVSICPTKQKQSSIKMWVKAFSSIRRWITVSSTRFRMSLSPSLFQKRIIKRKKMTTKVKKKIWKIFWKNWMSKIKRWKSPENEATALWVVEAWQAEKTAVRKTRKQEDPTKEARDHSKTEITKEMTKVTMEIAVEETTTITEITIMAIIVPTMIQASITKMEEGEAEIIKVTITRISTTKAETENSISETITTTTAEIDTTTTRTREMARTETTITTGTIDLTTMGRAHTTTDTTSKRRERNMTTCSTSTRRRKSSKPPRICWMKIKLTIDSGLCFVFNSLKFIVNGTYQSDWILILGDKWTFEILKMS